MTSTAKSHGLIAGLAAGVLFAVGYFLVALIPGGGDVTDKDFTDFYDSDGKRTTAFLLFLALVVGCFLLIWFFTELRDRIPVTMLSRIGYMLGLLGAALVLVGGAIMTGPTGAQMNSNAGFVGVNVAHAIAQSGLAVMLGGGMSALAVSVFTLSLAARRSAALPSWLATAGLVVGVLMLGSYIWLPGLLFPIWVIVVGVGGFRREPVASG